MVQAAPYQVSLDADHARQLAVTGAALLLLDVPQGTLLGVDQQVFVVGPRFKGLKMLPPGVHFLSYQAAGRDGRVSPAVSTFLALKPRDVVVRRWDAAQEGLVALADEDEVSRFAEGVRRFDFDSSLAPYDLAGCSQWHGLACFIDEPLLHRLTPVGGEISVMAEALDPDLMQPRTEAERRLVAQLQEGESRRQQHEGRGAAEMDTDQPPGRPANTHTGCDGAASTSGAASSAGNEATAHRTQQRWGRCFYTRLPRLVKTPGASGAELTALNLDKTAALEEAASQTGDPSGKALLGELQFAYITFLFGQSLEGFLQWKALVGLFLDCQRGPLLSHTGLFVAFLATVQQQLSAGLGLQQKPQRRQQRRRGGIGEGEGSSSDDTEDEGDRGASSEGGGALGLPLVEELLPDSFLRRQFGAFLEALHEEGTGSPPALTQQAAQLETLLRERLGWDFRVRQLPSGGCGCCGDEEGDDEDRPVVVELSQEERRLAGLEM